jgi:hypothetical protein
MEVDPQNSFGVVEVVRYVVGKKFDLIKVNPKSIDLGWNVVH